VIARQLVHDRTEGLTADRRRRHHARGARQRALLLVVAPALRHLLGRTDLSTGGGLLAVGVLHASFNASGSLDVLDGGWQHIVGLAVVAALTLIADVVRSRGTHDARTSSAAQCYTFLISVTPGREIAPAFHVRRVAGRRRYGSAGVSSSAHETASLPFSERIRYRRRWPADEPGSTRSLSDSSMTSDVGPTDDWTYSASLAAGSLTAAGRSLIPADWSVHAPAATIPSGRAFWLATEVAEKTLAYGQVGASTSDPEEVSQA